MYTSTRLNEDAVDALEPGQPGLAALAPRQTFSRAMLYWRSEKISVTLRVMPSAASSSRASSPAGVAGTLIIRFWWPAFHFLPSSMYLRRARRAASVRRRLPSAGPLEADVAVVALGLVPDRQEDLLGGLDELIVHFPGDFVVGVAFVDQCVMSSSNRPVLIRSETMIGLDVAPVRPGHGSF